MSPRKYTIQYLYENINKTNASLIGEYKDSELTQMSTITFKCKCNQIVEKHFRKLVTYGALCDLCSNTEHPSPTISKKTKSKKTIDKQNKMKEILNEYVLSDNATLIGELPKLTQEVRIHFRCKCGTEDSKTFVRIKESGVLCKECTSIQRRERREKTNLERYGSSCTLQSELIKKKAHDTCIQKYGTTNVFTCDKIKERIKQTNLEKYGSENPFGSEAIKSKLRETCIKKYGSEFPMKNPIIADKTKKTNLQKYGVEVSSKAEIVKEKAKQTNLRIYGKTHHFVPSVIEKIKQTNLIKYGHQWSFQSPLVKDSIKQTLIDKYGVNHSSKIKELVLKNVLTVLKN